MIKIVIEIPVMPENCHVCPLKHYVKSEVDSGCFCYKTKQLIQKQSNKRPGHCPLIEVKKCKFALWDDDSNTYECCECGLVWMLMEGTPIENQMEFCPKCGSKIEVQE